MNILQVTGTAVTVLAAACAMQTSARADAVADFYKGKTITFLVGSGLGGSYDLYARALAAPLAKHIPGNPTVVVKFTGGAGAGLPAALQMQNTALRDGTIFCMTQQTIVLSQVVETVATGKYDVTTWNWIGLIAPVRNMLSVWHTAPAQTLEAAREKQVVIGASARSSPTYIVPKIMNEVGKTKFKIVLGYHSANDLNLAMERGEIEGRGASWLSVITEAPQYITEKKLKPLIVDGLTREPSLPDVPRLIDLATTPDETAALTLISSGAEFGRALFFPPGVPAERITALRRAFDATMKDPDFLAEARKRQLPVEPQTGEELNRVAAKVVGSTSNAVALAKKLLGE